MTALLCRLPLREERDTGCFRWMTSQRGLPELPQLLLVWTCSHRCIQLVQSRPVSSFLDLKWPDNFWGSYDPVLFSPHDQNWNHSYHHYKWGTLNYPRNRVKTSEKWTRHDKFCFVPNNSFDQKDLQIALWYKDMMKQCILAIYQRYKLQGSRKLESEVLSLHCRG